MQEVSAARKAGVRVLWRGVLLAAVLLCGLGTLQGCTSSQWEQNYVGTSGAPPLAKAAPVQLREVPWDRVQSGLREIEAEQAKSDVHPEEWPTEKKAAVKGTLLKTLQVSEAPSTVEVVGRSAFRTTTPLSPESDKELVEFARREGADRVAWSRRLMGKADEIVQEPVTTFGTVYADRWGRRGSSVFTESSTTWVPIRVQSDEYAYVAYFLRIHAQ
jgi:hypothetical protein